MRVEWSQHAVADLRRISEYIGQDRSLEVANRISRVIYDAIQSLQTMLYQGRPGRVENTREILVQTLPYIVVYRVFEMRLLILNIVHGAQRWPN